MSSQLRTPLNHIIGFSELLVDNKLGALNLKQTGYLETILESGNHLLALVNNILEVVRIKSGQIKLEPEPFSLRRALEEICDTVQLISQEKHIQLDLEVGPHLVTITLDRRSFKQAFSNLLANAVKFTGTHGKVEVRACLGEQLFKVSIRD